MGNPIVVGGGVAVNPDHSTVQHVICEDKLGDPCDLVFRDPDNFRAGELHAHSAQWSSMIGKHPNAQQSQVLEWITGKVSIFPYFRHFSGSFKGEHYDSDRPTTKVFSNNISCQPFADFIRRTLFDRLANGAISLWGRVGQVPPPHAPSLTINCRTYKATVML